MDKELVFTQKGMAAIAASILLGIATLTVVVYTQSNKAIKQQAIDGCLKLVQVTQKTSRGDIRVPEEYWYKNCMQKKGYK